MILNEYKIGEQYLRELAAFTGGRVIKVEDEKEGLEKAFSRAVEEIQNLYFIGYRPQDSNEQIRQIKIRVYRPNLIVLGRDNYFFIQN